MCSSILNATTIPTETKTRRKKKSAMHAAEDEKDKSRKVNDIGVEQSDVFRHFKPTSFVEVSGVFCQKGQNL